MYWWKDFDAGEVDEEFAQIADYGFDLVRFFLLWEDFQPEPQTVDWSQLHNLETVMEMADKHHLRAMPTLFNGNMSGIMWFPSWAFSNEAQEGDVLQISQGEYVHKRLHSPFADPSMLHAEALLAESAAEMIGGHPALHSWDLANEIDQASLPGDPESAWLWAHCVSEAIRSVSEEDLITYGAHSLSLTTRGLTMPALAPCLDYLSMHSYPMYSEIARGPLDTELVPFMTSLTEHLGAKPTLMQEFGLCTSPAGEPSQTIEDTFLGKRRQQLMVSEEEAADYYATVLDRLWETGAMGAMAWDYADYPEALWEKPPLDLAKRERSFGVFRANHSAKPAAEVLKRFSEDVKTGEIQRRLGVCGSKAVHFDVTPEGYYQTPEDSFRESYATYLERIESQESHDKAAPDSALSSPAARDEES